MTTHVLILRSSPRKRANSSILADRLAEGCRAEDAAVDCYDLASMDIRPCDACAFCRTLGYGQCQIDDDMHLLYPRLIEADAIVIASPIYWFALSAQAKRFIDRWYALQGPQGWALAGKRFGLVLTYGDADPYASGGINAIRSLQDLCRYVGATFVDAVHANVSDPGEIEGQPEVLQRAYQLGQRLAVEGKAGARD